MSADRRVQIKCFPTNDDKIGIACSFLCRLRPVCPPRPKVVQYFMTVPLSIHGHVLEEVLYCRIRAIVLPVQAIDSP